jgi:hypothetical protein
MQGMRSASSPWPLYHRGNNVPCPLNRGFVGPRATRDDLEIFLVSNRTLYRPAPSLVTMTTLFRLTTATTTITITRTRTSSSSSSYGLWHASPTGNSIFSVLFRFSVVIACRNLSTRYSYGRLRSRQESGL